MNVYPLGVLVLAGTLSAQTAYLPLKDVRPGMTGVGKTVFSGSRVEEFRVEVLGVLDNVGPKQSIILGRLSGGPLAQTGVMQGMSGSPVYIDGKLAGAVAMAFAFSKEPIAGIRPIEEMLRVEPPASRRTLRARTGLFDKQLAAAAPPPQEFGSGEARMIDIATPISFGGFTRNTIDAFTPQLRALGLEPRQGMTGGARLENRMGNPASLEPGSMISVQLLEGDMNVGADGTVTHIDGNRVYAFGHRFLSMGHTEMPFARAEVLTLLPNISTSFKISSAREWMGAITQDRSAAVAGELGRRANMIPVSITVTRAPNGNPPFRQSYRMRMIDDRVLSPFLLQAAVFSSIDATEPANGTASYTLKGLIEFQDGHPPVRLQNVYAGDFNVPMAVSTGTTVPLAYVMQSGFEDLKLKNVSLEVEAYETKRQLTIDQIWSSKREVRPGDAVEITVLLTGENGVEITRKAAYRVPVGAPSGPILFTAADANTTNITEYRQMLTSPPKSATQLLAFMNGLRPNNKAYIRVWRAQPGFEVEGEVLHDPPPSVALILARSQASLGGQPLALANAKIAELEIDAGGMAVSGSKTIQVDVKE